MENEDSNPQTKSKRRTNAKTIAQIERVQKAIQMRKNGFTYDEIANSLGWKSKQAAFDAVSRALDKAIVDEAREYKLLSLMRLEKCIASVLKKAENGNLLAVDRIIRLTKREGEILGFDEVNGKDLNLGFEIVVRNESERNKRN